MKKHDTYNNMQCFLLKTKEISIKTNYDLYFTKFYNLRTNYKIKKFEHEICF